MFLSEWREFPSAPCLVGGKNLITARVSMLLKSRTSLTCFRVCFLPGRAKDLSAPRYAHILQLVSSFQVFQLHLIIYHFSHLFYTNRSFFFSITILILFGEKTPTIEDRQCMYERNIGARSCNHCCNGKTMRITFCECLSVALVIQHAMRMRRIIVPSVACLAVLYFLHYLISGTIFGTGLLF